jgi:hypothetical protein
MRSYRGSGGPEQVWNQVYFWYEALYREHSPGERGIPESDPGPEDENDIIVLCELRANMDHWNKGDPTGLPAEVDGNQLKPANGNSLEFHNKWRIQFDGQGKIKTDDPRNAWAYLINDKGEQLLAPTELMPLAKPLSERRSGADFSTGNEYLTQDIVDAGLLKIHKRYK